MINRKHKLPIARQAEVLRISRGSVYYQPRPVSAADLEVMRRVDRLHLEYPFAGSRMLRGLLAAEGIKIGRRHVKTLMRRMGIEALYRRPRTTKPEPGHKIYPYLLRGMDITRPNQVWAMDITYIPMAHGFVYLAVVLDWFSRRVLSWRLSITMEAAFCVETLEDALARHGKPDIFNTDQGSQFTGQLLLATTPAFAQYQVPGECTELAAREGFPTDMLTKTQAAQARVRMARLSDRDPLVAQCRSAIRQAQAMMKQMEKSSASAMQSTP